MRKSNAFGFSFLIFFRFQNELHPPLIVISLSGIRPDFLDRGKTPALDYFRRCGVHASAMHPVYPSNTMPNQYSLVTGLYPQSHGIVNNIFFDNETGVVFDFQQSSSMSDARFWKGEPIWVTAKKQGKSSFVDKWAGSEVNKYIIRCSNLY